MVLWMLIYSTGQVIFHWSPGAISSATDGSTFQWAWSAMLCTGSVMATVGIGLDIVRAGLLRRRPAREKDWLNDSTGLTLESAGMVFCGGALLFYGSIILAATKSSSALAGGTFVVFGLASLVRAFIIRRDLRRVARGEWRP